MYLNTQIISRFILKDLMGKMVSLSINIYIYICVCIFISIVTLYKYI